MTIEVKWKPEAEPKEALNHLRYLDCDTPSEAMDEFIATNMNLTVKERLDCAIGIIKTMNSVEYIFLEVDQDEDDEDWWKDDYGS